MGKNTIYLPSLPNSPLISKKQECLQGPVRLRYNQELGYLENEAFDVSCIDYVEGYENSQAFSSKFLDHMQSVLDLFKEKLPARSKIVEVGCGKGDFLELVQQDGIFEIIGFDASYEGDNPAIEKRYLDENDNVTADLIVLRHVLEHVQKPHNFLEILKRIFKNAKIYIEVPNYNWIVSNQTYFDITYEHVNYFSKKSLGYLFNEHVLEHELCFGEQYQFLIGELSCLSRNFSEAYNKCDNWEQVTFRDLFPGMLKKFEKIVELAGDKNVYVWGAATKGCMFLAHCANFSPLIEKIRFAIDVNPNKQNKFLPGSLVPIYSKDKLFAEVKKGDLLLISNPNYQDEIETEIQAANIPEIVIVAL